MTRSHDELEVDAGRSARRAAASLSRRPAAARRASSALSAAIAVAALAGCGSSPAIRYFTLEPVAPAATLLPASVPRGAYAGPPLQVRAVIVPASLDRAELVRQVAANRLEIRESDHWAAPLSRLAVQALSQDLAARLPEGSVVFPGMPLPEAIGHLTVDIRSFKIEDGRAAMSAGWALRWRGPAATPASWTAPRGAALTLAVPIGNDDGATARAWSELLARLADQVAAGLSAVSP